jgi:hypothetical protein
MTRLPVAVRRGGDVRRTIVSVLTAGAILSAGGFAAHVVAQGAHVIQGVSEAQWGPAPPFIPAGAELAVLSGNPTKAGPYAVRLKFPANYVIAAHSHPTDENVVVVSGAVTFGMGDKVNKGGRRQQDPGDWRLLPGLGGHEPFRVYDRGIDHRPVWRGTGGVQVRQPGRRPAPRNGDDAIDAYYAQA